jgi:hypothetical protein
VVGGVAAELGGGMSAAFSRMFNDLYDSKTRKWIGGQDPDIVEAVQRQNANAPNIPCFKSPLLPIMPDKNPAA